MWGLTCLHVIENAANTKDIAFFIISSWRHLIIIFKDFRGHIARGSTFFKEVFSWVNKSGKTKVCNFNIMSFFNKNVGRFEISVHDRMWAKIINGHKNGLQDLINPNSWEISFEIRFLQSVIQSFSFDQLHNQVNWIISLVNFIKLYNLIIIYHSHYGYFIQ